MRRVTPVVAFVRDYRGDVCVGELLSEGGHGRAGTPVQNHTEVTIDGANSNRATNQCCENTRDTPTVGLVTSNTILGVGLAHPLPSDLLFRRSGRLPRRRLPFLPFSRLANR